VLELRDRLRVKKAQVKNVSANGLRLLPNVLAIGPGCVKNVGNDLAVI
jgi:hypothetical protein